jgi:hypothetical protein
MDPENSLDLTQFSGEEPILSLEEIESMKKARLALLEKEIAAQRERIYAEYDFHKAAITADSDLDIQSAIKDIEASKRTELYALEDAHFQRSDEMREFDRIQTVSINKIATQLLAVARSQKSQKIIDDANQNLPLYANFNVALPYHTAPIPEKPLQ